MAYSALSLGSRLPAPAHPYTYPTDDAGRQVSIQSQQGIGHGAFGTSATLPPFASIKSAYHIQPTADQSNPQGFTWTAPPIDPAHADPTGAYGAYTNPPVDPYTDAGTTAAGSAENLGQSQLASAMRAARERAIIDFGDPAMASLAGFGLDPQAGAFAQQNYLSGNAVLARIDKAHADRRRAIINKLASQGMLFSGETGYESGQEGTQYAMEGYDARKKLLDYLQTLTENDLTQKRSLRDAMIAALQKSYTDRLNAGV